VASVNKVILIGNLGRDPEMRTFPDGSSLCNVAIATSRTWKDKTSGEKQEETEWHRLVAYGRTAEIMGEYLKKGSSAYFEGRLKTRKWTDKEGVERYTTEIIVEQMTMLGKREDGAAAEPAQRPSAGKPYADAKAGKAPAAKPATSTGFDDMDDDIPL
jgi:single-strand DNA-binding protein